MRRYKPVPDSPFKRFNSSSEVTRLVVIMYVRSPLSVRNIEGLLAGRGIDTCHETVRLESVARFRRGVEKAIGRRARQPLRAGSAARRSQEPAVPTIFTTELPEDATSEDVVRELQNFLGDTASVEARPSARSGQGGKLGSIDPSTWDIIVHLLDTQAAAAAVHTLLGGVSGYLFAKTGKKPSSKEEPDTDAKD